MSEQALYDLRPVFYILGLGLLLALPPWVWTVLRHRPAGMQVWRQRLTLLTLFLTFDLILFGAFTRLSDSGLGCPDWPGCYGQASPWGAKHWIEQAQNALPSGPVTHTKAWIEMLHRYFATGVGGLILLLAISSFFVQRNAPGSTLTSKKSQVFLPCFTLFWVCLQGAFGALTVTMKLFPAIVTLHLLGGMVLLALLAITSVQQAQNAGALPAVTLPKGQRRFLMFGLALLGLQIALGGWVSTNYAVLACNDFPTCQNTWWPAMDWREGFTLWRELGAGIDGGFISLQGLTAIHFAHRCVAAIVLTVLFSLAWQWRKVAGLQTLGRWLVLLSLAQLATGVANVVLNWPMLAALAHTGGAAGLVLVLTRAAAVTRVTLAHKQTNF